MESKPKRYLLFHNQTAESFEKVAKFSPFTVSKQQKKILFQTQTQKLWRHSSVSTYLLYDLASKEAATVGSTIAVNPQDPSLTTKLSYVVWSHEGNHLAWVRNNDVFLTLNGASEVQITKNGSPNRINGVADWVYEEEVFEAQQAMWFSPNDQYLAFLSFDDESVLTYPLQYFENPQRLQYPNVLNVKYPKPGTPNPRVIPYVVDLTTTPPTLLSVVPKRVPFEEDAIISEVIWLDAVTLQLRVLNRVQDTMMVYVAQSTSSDGGSRRFVANLIRKEAHPDGAWMYKVEYYTQKGPHSLWKLNFFLFFIFRKGMQFL